MSRADPLVMSLHEGDATGEELLCAPVGPLELGVKVGYYLYRAWQIMRDVAPVPPPP